MQKAMAAELERYGRQILFQGIGEAGQRKLLAATVVVIGCGALGTVIANHLVRAGVGRLVIADRDFIELNNLQRQLLFDEEDIAQGLPKAVAAAQKLRRINSAVEIEPVVADVHFANIETLIQGASVVLDGTDNFETRYLINDACVKNGIPWIYGGVIGASGMTMTIVPHRTPCLRCLFAEMPPPGTAPTCDTAGVLGPVVATIASLEAAEAMKLITGSGRRNEGLISVDLWENRFDAIAIAERTEGCPACGRGNYEYLAAREGIHTTTLCGHNAVQVSVKSAVLLDLAELATRLRPIGEVAVNEFLLRLKADDHELTIFPDARAIIQGTTDVAVAKTLYAKYVGI
ncbi:MAG: ThiF family adenylyltransferase [Deltaproteobacteria bacterium]|nr:ThiF family adenylyltransferase [Deltaproteobacteria bacterium]